MQIPHVKPLKDGDYNLLMTNDVWQVDPLLTKASITEQYPWLVIPLTLNMLCSGQVMNVNTK